MSKGNKKAAPVQLTRKQQKEIELAIQRAKGADGTASAQDTIPYEAMWPDGLCRLGNGLYSMSILFQDINYRIASDDEQESAFNSIKDFYNSLDPSYGLQLTILKHEEDRSAFTSNLKTDGMDPEVAAYGREYSNIIQEKQAYGNNGMMETKMFTVSLSARNEREARVRLRRAIDNIGDKLSDMGVQSEKMNGKRRLQVLHDIFHPFGEPFEFDWNYLPASGLTTKDFIAPSSFVFSEGKKFAMGDAVCRMSYVQIATPELWDDVLSRFLDNEDGILLNLHIRAIERSEALKMIKRKMSDLDAMKIQEQKKATRGGYGIDIIPAELDVYGSEAKQLFHKMSSEDQQMFFITFLVMNYAKTKKRLDYGVELATSVAKGRGCNLTCLDYQQEDGFVSSLPLGLNRIKIQRSINTESLALFVPFMTQELFQDGESLYYGVNPLSGNIIMANRKQLMNPNGLILGSSGGGKSFSAKREILNVFFATVDDIRILDPEAEYGALVEALHGQLIKISPGSGHYVNPMDINLDYSDDDNPLALKSDFILSFCETIAGGKSGLGPVEKSVIDRAVHKVYRPYFENPVPENMPILTDLYREILEQPEAEAARIASALELYVMGSQNIFNHRTNVDVHNRLVCFDIKELGKQLKLLGMLVIQDQIWNLVNLNQAQGRSTRYYVDEFHLLLKGEIASWSVEIWKRFRKWGGIPTGITQNIQDLFASKEIESIFENSDFIYLLSQGPKDREVLTEMLHISDAQVKYIAKSKIGEGLIFFGNTVIPFSDHFPTDTRLYKIMSTKLSDKEVVRRKVVKGSGNAGGRGFGKSPVTKQPEPKPPERKHVDLTEWFVNDPVGYDEFLDETLDDTKPLTKPPHFLADPLEPFEEQEPDPAVMKPFAGQAKPFAEQAKPVLEQMETFGKPPEAPDDFFSEEDLPEIDFLDLD